MGNYLFYLLNEMNTGSTNKFIEIITPASESERGCQVSILMRENGKKIYDALHEKGIFADWREPSVIRIAPVPLYNTFQEIWKFSDILKGEL